MIKNTQDAERVHDEKATERKRINLAFAAEGVEFFDLSLAQIDADAKIGAGTYIGPGTIIKGKSIIGENCIIEQGCRIENTEIGNGCNVDHSVLLDSKIGENTTVGPFAYIRPGSNIGDSCRIGDFVEIKNSNIGNKTKVSHLTYIGDADLGSGINVGCGVVFVNYDGREKHRSTVGDGSFIGCNVNIVSPVKVGTGAYIAAGGTVTADVPSGALHVARSKDKTIEGWVERRGLLKRFAEKKEVGV